MTTRHGHTHRDYPEDTTGITASMMMVILAVLAALVLLGLVFAWNPWAANGGGAGPGQGGDDNQPAQEEQLAPNPR